MITFAPLHISTLPLLTFIQIWSLLKQLDRLWTVSERLWTKDYESEGIFRRFWTMSAFGKLYGFYCTHCLLTIRQQMTRTIFSWWKSLTIAWGSVQPTHIQWCFITDGFQLIWCNIGKCQNRHYSTWLDMHVIRFVLQKIHRRPVCNIILYRRIKAPSILCELCP